MQAFLNTTICFTLDNPYQYDITNFKSPAYTGQWQRKDDDNTRATNQKQQSNFIPRQEQSEYIQQAG